MCCKGNIINKNLQITCVNLKKNKLNLCIDKITFKFGNDKHPAKFHFILNNFKYKV